MDNLSGYAHRPFPFVLRYLRRRLASHVVILSAVVAAVACSVGTQYGVKYLVDGLSAGSADAGGVWLAFVLLISLISADNFLWRIASWTASFTFVGVTGDLRRDIFRHLTGHAPSYFSDRLPGMLTSRITATSNAVFTVENMFVWNVLPPCVVRSGAECAVEGAAVRIGLGYVNGVRAARTRGRLPVTAVILIGRGEADQADDFAVDLDRGKRAALDADRRKRLIVGAQIRGRDPLLGPGTIVRTFQQVLRLIVSKGLTITHREAGQAGHREGDDACLRALEHPGNVDPWQPDQRLGNDRSCLFRGSLGPERSEGRDDLDSLGYYGFRGFEEIGRMQDVVLDVSAATVDPATPEGIEIVPATPEHDRGVYAVALEAVPDIPAAAPMVTGDFESWHERQFGPLVSRELSQLALDDGVVVGFGIVGRFTDDTYQHWMTGVARQARGRGIALALKAAQIAAAKRAGLRYLRTQNDLANAGMRRVNERLGYVRRYEWVHLGGPLRLG